MSRAVQVSWICAFAAELAAIEAARSANPGPGADARTHAACNAHYRERVCRAIRDLRGELDALELEEARAEQMREGALADDVRVAFEAFEADSRRRNPEAREDA